MERGFEKLNVLKGRKGVCIGDVYNVCSCWWLDSVKLG